MRTNETRKQSTMHPILDSQPRSQWLTTLLLTIVGVNLIECHFGPWIHTPTTHPCIFEDHLVTDKNWHGYLANITVMTTGRLSFEFSYPVDKCCQNILFYSEDQMSIINARMNCWQKEYLLRPEEDQILRLTPKFSWSGCHMTYPNDIATYVCKGGRSFTVEQVSTWFIILVTTNLFLHRFGRCVTENKMRNNKDRFVTVTGSIPVATDFLTITNISPDNAAKLHKYALKYQAPSVKLR